MKVPNWWSVGFIVAAVVVVLFWVSRFRDPSTSAAAVPWSGVVALVCIWLIIGAMRGGQMTFRHLFNGEDNRPSTSKFQFFIWTAAVLYAFVTIYIARFHQGVPELIGEIPPNLLVAMGLSLGTAIAAKAITTNKVAQGDVSKPDATQPAVQAASAASGGTAADGVAPRHIAAEPWPAQNIQAGDTLVVTSAKPNPSVALVPSEAANCSTTRLILDDNGNPDLGKIQLLAWTFVGIGIYLALVLKKAGAILATTSLSEPCTAGLACGGLPDIDPALMVLMGLGQAAYLGNKLVTSTTPRLTGLYPAIGDDKTPITLTGTGLGDTQNGSIITMDGFPATPTLLSSNANPGWQDTQITFDLPPEHPNARTPYDSLATPIQIGVIVGGQRSANTLPFTFKPQQKAGATGQSTAGATIQPGAPPPLPATNGAGGGSVPAPAGSGVVTTTVVAPPQTPGAASEAVPTPQAEVHEANRPQEAPNPTVAEGMGRGDVGDQKSDA